MHDLFGFIWSAIEVKQVCPFPPPPSTLFKVFIDEVEEFLEKRDLPEYSSLVHIVLISLRLFIRDVVLIASSLEGVVYTVKGPCKFCNCRQLVVNISKTKVMVFNTTKDAISRLLFFFSGTLEATIAYNYLGVKFTGSTCNLRSVKTICIYVQVTHP